MHQALHQIAPVRQVRADHRGLLVAEVHPQHAMDHAQCALVPLVLGDEFVELDRRGELHARLAPQHQDAEQLAQAPGDRPAVGEQQLPGAGLAIRRLPPEHADRNDLRVLYRVVLQRADQPHQRRWCDQTGTPAEPAGCRIEEEEGGRLHQFAHRHIGHRAWQSGLAALGIEHGEIAQRGLLQYIEHRLAAIQLEGEGGLVDGLRAHPGVQHTAHQGEDQTANGGAGHTADSTVEGAEPSKAASVPQARWAGKTCAALSVPDPHRRMAAVRARAKSVNARAVALVPTVEPRWRACRSPNGLRRSSGP